LKEKPAAANVTRVPLSTKSIRDLYNSLSYFYDLLTGYEEGTRSRALAMVDFREVSEILEVGFGTGKILIEFAKKVVSDGEVYGLEISQGMIEKTKRSLRSRHLLSRVHLVLGDAAHTPFRDAAFDLVFNSYMLDLIDTPSIPRILSDFKRLLKPAGRLVLVSLTKGTKWYDNMGLYEWIYRRSPTLLGGCRPVVLKPYLQQLGFKNLDEYFMHAGHLMPTIILRADKAS
jgi:ubiquinone/menaquinone biosynthesis C-methylase UbiE